MDLFYRQAYDLRPKMSVLGLFELDAQIYPKVFTQR